MREFSIQALNGNVFAERCGHHIAYIKYRMCDKEIFFGKDTKHVKMLVQKVTQKFFSDSFCDIFFTVIILILWILINALLFVDFCCFYIYVCAFF